MKVAFLPPRRSITGSTLRLLLQSIVEDHHLMPLLQQLNAGMTSNVTATTCNQTFMIRSIRLIVYEEDSISKK